MMLRRSWLGPALLLVGLVTGWRILALAFNRTDLFVDESQYWLWGQNLDLGYYSKPPMIGWLIRAFTTLAGSDTPFWVRLPGALLHGATALVLGALAARIMSERAGFWAAATYVTTPFTAVGAMLISTDSIMAPFYAAALYAWFRLVQTRGAGFALMAGAMLGGAFLSKYAAVYFLIGAGLSAAFLPSQRVGWRNAALLLLSFAIVISPNIWWNLTHDLTTVGHTMDNIGWVEQDRPLASVSLASMLVFFFSQFGVFGPLSFGALLLAAIGWRRGDDRLRSLILFSLPPLLIVCFQALMDRAYANWALAAYFPGTLVAVGLLDRRAPRLLLLSGALNLTVAVALPLLAITAPWPMVGGKPALARYLGLADRSHAIFAAAAEAGATRIVADSRDVLADLFYTGRDQTIPVFAPRPTGRPANYYEQEYPLPTTPAPTLLVSTSAPMCNGSQLTPLRTLDTQGGAPVKRALNLYVLPVECSDVSD